jgi:hypothetical protein
MTAIDFGRRRANALDRFECLLLEHKADIGMDDIDDAELLQQAPLILRSLVRLSIAALRDPDGPDSVRRLAALDWFVEWASRDIDGYPDAAL